MLAGLVIMNKELRRMNLFPEIEGFYTALNPRGVGVAIFHICNDENKWLIFNSFKNPTAGNIPKDGYFTIEDYCWFNEKIISNEKITCKECDQLIKG